MTRLDIDRDDDTPRRRLSDQPPSVMKVISVTLGAITIGGLVFTAGYNWRGVDVLDKNQENFVRKDVLSEQFRAMYYKFDELSRQIDELRGEQRDARRKP